MPSNSRKGRDLSRLGMVGSPEAGAAWQSLVSAASAPGERMEGARLLPLELIEPAPGQPRRRFDTERLRSLSSSIKEDGMIQPIVVRPHPGRTGKFLLVAGERRWRACALAGIAQIPAIITDETDDSVTARMMLRENTEREDLDIEDLGLYLRMLSEQGATQRDLAALTHYSLGKVNGLLQLVKHPDLLEKIRNGGLTQEQALEMISGNKKPGRTAPNTAADKTAQSQYRPLARLATWAATFKARRVPEHERAMLREHIDETIRRLAALRDELGEQESADSSRGSRGGAAS